MSDKIPGAAPPASDRLATIENQITTHRLYIEHGSWSPSDSPWNTTYTDVVWLMDEVRRLRKHHRHLAAGAICQVCETYV